MGFRVFLWDLCLFLFLECWLEGPFLNLSDEESLDSVVIDVSDDSDVLDKELESLE
jgi:hypothetical protein